ncbi:MAG TPA: glycosyltransferase [Candidatus Limnocylindria bacterium]|nr:glycosyltransferase [Candidatus Limnocylindria bacterium]
MRIVLTTESYLPYISGVTISVEGLARGLRARGHDVLVVAPRPASGGPAAETGASGPAPEIAWLDSYQLPWIAPPMYRMPWPHPWSGALRTAAAFEPDIVHAHSPFVTGLLALRLARATRAPLVFTHHTRFADYGHYLGPLAPIGMAGVEAYLSRFWHACAAVIAPSHDMAAAITDRGGARRIEVIPTGVDVDAIRGAVAVDVRATSGWPADAVVVASLGRLAPEKSSHVVLDAVAGVEDLRLLVIGGGPSEAALRQRAERPDLAGRVAFTGALPHPDALARLKGADLFAFASRTETQGLVLAEALAAGLPAVAVEGPGVADSIRDGVDGIIVPAEPQASRADRLGATLATLVHDRDARARMAADAAEGAQRFDIGRRIGQVEELYRSMVEG